MLELKALQTYSDGTVVPWIDPTPKSGPETDHPAPALTLTKASSDTNATATGATTAASSSSDSTARTVGIVGIVVGALGLILAAAAFANARRAAS